MFRCLTILGIFFKLLWVRLGAITVSFWELLQHYSARYHLCCPTDSIIVLKNDAIHDWGGGDNTLSNLQSQSIK